MGDLPQIRVAALNWYKAIADPAAACASALASTPVSLTGLMDNLTRTWITAYLKSQHSIYIWIRRSFLWVHLLKSWVHIVRCFKNKFWSRNSDFSILERSVYFIQHFSRVFWSLPIPSISVGNLMTMSNCRPPLREKGIFKTVWSSFFDNSDVVEFSFDDEVVEVLCSGKLDLNWKENGWEVDSYSNCLAENQHNLRDFVGA